MNTSYFKQEKSAIDFENNNSINLMIGQEIKLNSCQSGKKDNDALKHETNYYFKYSDSSRTLEKSSLINSHNYPENQLITHNLDKKKC